METEHVETVWLGSPGCGLVGPHAFEFQWTFQRNADGRYNQRRASHRVLPQWRGQVFYIEAAELPISRIRHAGLELVDGVWELLFASGALDDSIWAALDKHCCWNLLAPISTDVCSREGTRMELKRLRRRWMCRYGKWQRLALANGRYFPPPAIAVLTARFEGEVQLWLSWGKGYAPADLSLLVQRSASYPWMVLPREASQLISWREAIQ